MRVAYVDCFSGVSGDMFLGALVDAGLPIEQLRTVIATLPIDGYVLLAEPVVLNGISGHSVTVRLSNRAAEPQRHLSDVQQIIRSSTLDVDVVERACAVFDTLAEAEAEVHGIPKSAVHFHEVGAVDAIVDIVGAVWGLRQLGVEKLYSSSLPTGSGVVQTAHGPLPVPAPATLEILSRVGAPLRASPATTELVTPTGAALLATLATFEQPAMHLRNVGYGFGQKVMPWPNVARIWIGDISESSPDLEPSLETDDVVVIEANLDDELPEIIGATLDLLLSQGALDVFFTPIQMKRNRPAVKLTVLAPLDLARALSTTVLKETSTLGVRSYVAHRLKSRRWQQSVDTPWGEVRLKVKEFGGERRAAPEYADCLAIARQHGIPLPEVYAAANDAARSIGLSAQSSNP